MDKNIVKLAVDLAKGKVQKYSSEDANDTLRQAFADLLEFSLEGDGRIDRKTFRRHKTEIFELLEVILNETINEGLEGQLSQFAEYRNLAWGDSNVFKTPASQHFRVALVSDGNSNLRRQRLVDGQEFTVSTDTYAIKVGEDFHRFLAGRVNWVDFVNGVSEAFQRDLMQRVYDAVINSYGQYGATYHADYTSGSLTEDDILNHAMHIEARTGESVGIYGTKLALRNMPRTSVAEGSEKYKAHMLDNMYYGNLANIPLYEIKNSHAIGTDDFIVSNDFLLILPQNPDKMVKVINEGDAIMQDQQGGQTADMMQEYFVANKFGISVIATKAYGYIKFDSGANGFSPTQ